MTDDGIIPVQHINGAIGAYMHFYRAKAPAGGDDQRFNKPGFETRSIVTYLHALYAVIVIAGHDKISLQVVGQVCGTNDGQTGPFDLKTSYFGQVSAFGVFN